MNCALFFFQKGQEIFIPTQHICGIAEKNSLALHVSKIRKSDGEKGEPDR